MIFSSLVPGAGNAAGVSGFEFGPLSPVIVIFTAGVLGVLVEAFSPAKLRRPMQLVLAVGATIIALIALVTRVLVLAKGGPLPLANGEIVEDGLSLAAQIILVVVGFLAILAMSERTSAGDGAFAAQPADRPGSIDEAISIKAGINRTEFFPLSLLSLGGMMVFTSANSLLTLFIALEVMSLPLYVMAASARRKRLLSQEAALKYFILGAFSSAFFLMGVALLYGATGSVVLSQIGRMLAFGLPPAAMLPAVLPLLGVVLIGVGLLFKIGAAPFHAWTPDVYQGAPSPVTGFMAAAVKVAAFAALARFAWIVGGFFAWNMAVVLWVIAIATMVIGTVVGVVQSDVKRMLAYSSVAHAGFLLIGIYSLKGSALGDLMFYLGAYGVATVGAFAIVALVRKRGSQDEALGEATELSAWAGLGRTNPVLAGSMMIFLLSFAGIPLTSGFIGKFLVFADGVSAGLTVLVVVAVLCSAATAFFYLRLVRIMFLDAPCEQTLVLKSEGMSGVVVVLAAIVTVILGVFPAPVLHLLANTAIVIP